ncbi:hypothetical protein [Colwellia sp. TT2012]|nr:hypothetical protein [Colwellia sp. TT2012]
MSVVKTDTDFTVLFITSFLGILEDILSIFAPFAVRQRSIGYYLDNV